MRVRTIGTVASAGVGAALLTASALLLGGTISTAAQSPDVATMGKGADIAPLCGTKPMVVALVDGYGGDTWRKTAFAEFRDEAAKCKNITKVLYANANGDRQKANSDINSLVAQGVNVIVAFNDFGDAMLPAYRAAQKAGAVVVPYFSQLSGVPGKDFSEQVLIDAKRLSHTWADWLGANVKSGNVVFLGGIAGAASSQRLIDGLKEGLQKYPDIKLLDQNFIVTNWNPADAQRAVAGLIAKYGQIDAIVSDYGVTTNAAIKAYEQAGLPVPAQLTGGSNNELNCKYLNARHAGKAWKYLTLDGTTTLSRFALRRGVSNFEGVSNPEPLSVASYVYADSAKAVDPKCDPAFPPDADLSSILSEDQLKGVVR
ncbi:substrate-binding domain-containing protein [Bradyrhizobium tropiciagri]|uniref:substrate-binding domain-containing protein n=1 Tax=Bradyrhizobium tropiciagri TaxID=312253 RepID=UPI001BAC1B91|nr:substrate-binding domain-containing protein [Bradyrhizobium tropiciagri]MBR0896694.1 substrate-binding domain-containing protein [Bradyrhizobium tropiciagri]